MKMLVDKIALITGGSSGIGLATAKRFALEGAQVIITGRRQDELDRAVAEIGNDSIAIRSDVTSVAELEALFDKIGDTYGRVDMVFANAGSLRISEVKNVSESEYDQVFGSSVKGAIFTVQKALPLMQSGGVIILVSAAIAQQGIKGLGLNAAAKSAVRSLARTLTAELSGQGIRVNTLSPGTIATPLLSASGMSLERANEITDGGAPIPMGRVGTVEEAAAAALFLASSDSSYITGIDLAVDGGQAQI